MPTAIIVISQEDLLPFTRPALDLQTWELIELDAEPVPVQLELFDPMGQTVQRGSASHYQLPLNLHQMNRRKAPSNVAYL